MNRHLPLDCAPIESPLFVSHSPSPLCVPRSRMMVALATATALFPAKAEVAQAKAWLSQTKLGTSTSTGDQCCPAEISAFQAETALGHTFWANFESHKARIVGFCSMCSSTNDPGGRRRLERHLASRDDSVQRNESPPSSPSALHGSGWQRVRQHRSPPVQRF